jgi:hypothetical protein
MDLTTFIATYMDHAEANIMTFVNHEINTETIVSEFNHLVKEKALHKSESTMHHLEQQMQAKYYKCIKDHFMQSKDILLFGTTTAKDELLNILKEDAHFDTKNIVVEHTDKLTPNQREAFVKNYIKKHIK